jgi:hypothetical protein
MNLLKQVKTTANETAILLMVPDSLLDQFINTVNELRERWLNDDQSQPTNGPTTNSIADILRQAASHGDRMTPGKIKRIKEVLGANRAESIFGPHWGAPAWQQFQVVDPLRFQKQGDTWKLVKNDRHNPLLLKALMELPGEDPADLEADQTMPKEGESNLPHGVSSATMSPQECFEKVVELSLQGKELSDAQRRLIDRTLKGAVGNMFRGGRSGAMDFFLRIYNRSRQKEDKSGYEPNPNFRKDAYDYAVSLIKGG